MSALLVLAIAASSALVFTDRVELLKLAVILALWAAVVAAFVSVIYRRQSDSDQAKVRDLKLVYDTEPHEDSFGHGTACAGVIRSIAPACELYSVKVLGGKNSGKGRVFAAGLRWAIDNGMHVCNLSLGTTKRDFFSIFHELADDAYFKNVALITAANNMPIPSYPSVYSSVISVASHAVQDPYTFFYNPKPPVEFGALGIDVDLAWLDHKRRTMTGNSYASPHLAGIVAKILGNHPGLTVFQLKTILRELSDNVDRNQVSSPPRLLGENRRREGDVAE